jgi:hypothetical protein
LRCARARVREGHRERQEDTGQINVGGIRLERGGLEAESSLSDPIGERVIGLGRRLQGVKG